MTTRGTMLIAERVDLPGNAHATDPGRPAKVTGAAHLRISWADIIDPGTREGEPLTEAFMPQYRPSGVYGLAGLEAQEYAALWFGPPEVISPLLRKPETRIDLGSAGMISAGWPGGPAWDAYLPPGTWCKGGQGIVAHIGPVVLYEIIGKPAYLSRLDREDPDGRTVPVVTWHCTVCHRGADAGERWSSASPDDRMAAGRRARRHAASCEGPQGYDDELAAAAASAVHGRKVGPVEGMYAARCATFTVQPHLGGRASSCAEVQYVRERG